ncbi:hypothetical protein SE17_37940 [Kouleothrix aurantiaca]|uniref:Uncharacterized protein n=1 Tax=Kouleothrix aurantiaca TaxID=186479 RepID=A0A0P9D7B5_9CHLR|nr:hypothetical protein SE17_37940 [Kouleothrix aurantiaca]
MLSDGRISPWKLAVCFLGLAYGVLLGMKLPDAGLVLTVAIVSVSAAIWYIANRGYSLWLVMPAITGLIILISSAVALYSGYPPTSFVPVTRTDIELWLALLLAFGYIAWGVYETQHMAVI